MKSILMIPMLAILLGSCTNGNVPPQSNSTTNMVTPTISSGTTSVEIRDILMTAYSEEMLAHDVYTKMVEKYPNLVEVNNIINSEANHQEQVGKILDVRNIPRPTNYGIYETTYSTLMKMVDTSLTGAIEAGIMIEVGDIDHLLSEYQKIEDQDVRMVFENIGGGSFNHLRAFLRLAQNNNYTVATDYARYMKLDEIGSTGPLQSKMTELLKSHNLPTYGNSGTRGMGNRQGAHNTENGTGDNNNHIRGGMIR